MIRWLRRRHQDGMHRKPLPEVPPAPQDLRGAQAQAEAESASSAQALMDDPSEHEPVIDTSKPLLTVTGVERSFSVGGHELHVLKGIDMELFPTQLVMLKGRSGSGKTTLLNLIGGLDLPNRGEIRFKEHWIHQCSDDRRTYIRKTEIGFIFQSFALMPLLSAWENVELSLRMAGRPRSEWKARVAHCLELVGLGKRMHHRPFELSGGEQQRVAIAKAIAHKPSLLLADEPTAELDSQMGAQVMTVFRDIIRTERMTICMTTHDPTIMEVADRVFEMVDGKFINS
ncbi:ABC transporter ATP-binding protein [Paenibacillus naphthalenovorans]|uniref:Macrolide ABC transporter ATP-binding protein n=1 Tax=Paenibacillus naphthalenovorans TaxID=162209 RepID=A0A0U2VPH7_9BACL|nr:ABC transporter ATP-binding protein [Paenibacillus naphthalenovorans]ALS21431.1 macrolide ABC transporter ATP-binding protein [Paenibacillus naphthalenovorans]GCL72691.1 ABC transporter ATP-binding protein [Paenibacillus naphthalenovorans]SDJ54742.1 putative ABC transport system ATP-binding protein [Paenibacillus naphthalenovorans]